MEEGVYFQEVTPPKNENDEYTGDKWAFNEVKLFETIMTQFEENGSMAFFEKVALTMPWRTMTSIKLHYKNLTKDLKWIKSSKGEFEDIVDEDPMMEEENCESVLMEDTKMEGEVPKKISRPKKIRNRWSTEEHKSFLEGLETCKKGDWKGIAKKFVPSKTPAQVASHAQKYDKRMHTKTPPEKRRQTINDIRCLCCNSGPCKSVSSGLPT